MKKLILFIGFILMVFKVNAQVNIKNISLNGIKETDAEKMINFYQDNKKQDKGPTKQSIWFDWATFKQMVDLLKMEKEASKGTPQPTDGMRIYFASNPGTGPGRLKNIIVLLSTQFLIKAPNVPSGALHSDYYEHDINDPLFKDTLAIRGKIYKKRFYRRGDKLYSKIKVKGSCNIQGRHYITRDTAENMVQRFGLDTMKTKSEWFDLDFLDSFVNDPNATIYKYDGVRIYFARHDKNEQDIDGQHVFDRESFIMVPTTSNGIIFKDHLDRFDCMQMQKYYVTDDANKRKRHGFIDKGTPGGQDNGELCPDNCKPNH